MIGPIRVLGVKDTLQAFVELPLSVENMTMRIAFNAGAGVIRDAAAANAPKQTGLLARSQKIKVRVPNASYNVAHHKRPAYAVIGTDADAAGVVTRSGGKFRTGIARARKAQARGASVRVRKPLLYSRKVERRTHYLSRASMSHGAAAQAKVIAKLRDGLMNWKARRQARLNSGLAA